MESISFWMWKGGTGKTTCAVNLAAALGERGAKVLVVDLDPQASATRLLGEQPEIGMLDVLRGDLALEELAIETRSPAVQLVPAGPDLNRVEQRLRDDPDRAERLRMALDELPEDWDYVLLDCAPGPGLMALSATIATDGVAAVVDPRPLSVLGLPASMELLDVARARPHAGRAPARLLLSRLLGTRASFETGVALRRHFAERAFRAGIPECPVVIEASSHCEPVVRYAPEHPVSDAFRELACEVMPERRTSQPEPIRRRDVLDWLQAHPEAVRADPVHLVERCENAVRRHAVEDAWRHARELVEDHVWWLERSWRTHARAGRVVPEVCHELADELRTMEPGVPEGEAEQLAGPEILSALDPAAREVVCGWVRELARHEEHRAWLDVVAFTEAVGPALAHEEPHSLREREDARGKASRVVQWLAREYASHLPSAGV